MAHSDYYLTARKFWKTVTDSDIKIPDAQLQLQLEAHKRLFSVFQAGSYYYIIFNMYKSELDFVDANITRVLGYEPEEMNIAFFMENIHPDDKPYFLNFEYRVVEFFKALPFDKVPKYKVQYDIRIRAKNNTYVRLLHQAVQIDYDEKNYYRTLSLHTDISHIKQDGAPCFSLIGLDGEPSYYNIQESNIFTKSYDQFTRREREILKCIVEGKSSKEIAGELFISLHTVNAHRKNLLSKAGVKTPVELVRVALKEAWV
ncbi:LuxR C-terminal-related transcriptional regulator [Chitinophaga lutea]|nr:LuxR C-terminal-related transcriptional regulator [Chitinophaga lutea]